jgi:hypothetical protein
MEVDIPAMPAMPCQAPASVHMCNAMPASAQHGGATARPIRLRGFDSGCSGNGGAAAARDSEVQGVVDGVADHQRDAQGLNEPNLRPKCRTVAFLWRYECARTCVYAARTHTHARVRE